MKLEGEQLRQLQHGILSAFPKRADLEKLSRIGLNENLKSIVEGGSNADLVFNLIEWAEAHGRLPDLIAAAYRENPTNPALREAVRPFMTVSQIPEQGRIPIISSTPPRLIDSRVIGGSIIIAAIFIGAVSIPIANRIRSSQSEQPANVMGNIPSKPVTNVQIVSQHNGTTDVATGTVPDDTHIGEEGNKADDKKDDPPTGEENKKFEKKKTDLPQHKTSSGTQKPVVKKNKPANIIDQIPKVFVGIYGDRVNETAAVRQAFDRLFSGEDKKALAGNKAFLKNYCRFCGVALPAHADRFNQWFDETSEETHEKILLIMKKAVLSDDFKNIANEAMDDIDSGLEFSMLGDIASDSPEADEFVKQISSKL